MCSKFVKCFARLPVKKSVDACFGQKFYHSLTQTVNKYADIPIRKVDPCFGQKSCHSLAQTVNKYAEIPIRKPFKLHRLESSPKDTVHITAVQGRRLYQELYTIRRLEEQSYQLYKQNYIRGFCHLYDGQEACCVGIESSIAEDDAVITAYRGHGWAVTRGLSLDSIFAEMMGRVIGCSRGKGGSMHMYDKDKEFYGGCGIVGAQVPLGTGIALALKRQDKGNVCITAYGDGSANQGQIFEAFNMAKLWKLPVIFVCENNQYGSRTSAAKVSASTDFYTRGDYIPGIWVDGMDVLAVRECTRFAKQYALQHGPIIMECDTYRYFGRSPVDDASYRPDGEIETVRKESDPLMLFRNTLLDVDIITDNEIEAIERHVNNKVDEAISKAKQAPVVPSNELFTHVYTEQCKVRGCESTT